MTISCFNLTLKSPSAFDATHALPLRIFAAFLLLGSAWGLSASFSLAAQTIATAPRQPAAVELLTQQLRSLGGADAWQHVKGAKVSGIEKSTHEQGDIPFTWEDHWEQHYKMYRDSSHGGKRRRLLQDADNPTNHPEDSANSSSTTKLPTPPQFDPGTALLSHLPGAALEHILKGREYEISLSMPHTELSSSVAGLECVHILKIPKAATYAPVNIFVCSSPQDHRPAVAIIELRDLIDPSHKLYEAIWYKSFRENDGGLIVPVEVEIRKPHGRTDTYLFNGMSLNPELDKAFVGGQQ